MREHETIMFDRLKEKFSQNQSLDNYLKNTKTLQLVEASLDKFWGSGLPLSNKQCLVSSSFTGSNHLGQLLMRLRDLLNDQTTPRPPLRKRLRVKVQLWFMKQVWTPHQLNIINLPS